jgi:hypothetical protein
LSIDCEPPSGEFHVIQRDDASQQADSARFDEIDYTRRAERRGWLQRERSGLVATPTPPTFIGRNIIYDTVGPVSFFQTEPVNRVHFANFVFAATGNIINTQA